MRLSIRQTGIGKIGIAEDSGAITNLFLETDPMPPTAEPGETPLIQEAFLQLEAYLAGDLREFTLPLAPSGTPFMQSVWNALRQVPYGTTATYGEIASAVGNPQAFRAVGLANNRNPIPVFIPCHRIIGAGGKLVGYRGGLEMKRLLLEMEGHAGPFVSSRGNHHDAGR